MLVPIGVSARHIHLSQEHLDILFGNGHQLRIHKELSQQGQFAAVETLKIASEYGHFPTVRVLGPVRRKTQIEISRTDSYKLGIRPPVKLSGDLLNTPGIKLIGPEGEVTTQDGLIIPARHIHMSPEMAAELGVKERQTMYVRLGGLRPMMLERVYARISSLFSSELHIDTDDANAAGAVTGDFAEIIGIQPFSSQQQML